MACDFPLKGFRRPPEAGDNRLTFNPLKALNSSNPISVPCGRCTGCRLERSRQWAVRCQHEAQLHEENSFITLTFSDAHLPLSGSVDVRDVQLFMKRLRKAVAKPIRFLASGEYGDLNKRPHYHAIIFGHSFLGDRVEYRKGLHDDPEYNLFTSRQLSQCWPYGLATLGSVTFNSAAYVARYSMKKITGDAADQHYVWPQANHGFLCRVKPEFLVMSRRPGIGAPWLERFRSDVYPSDQVIVRGVPTSPPRFYDNHLTEEELEQIKRRRKKDGLVYKPHQTNERRRARAAVRDARISTLKREL